MKQLNVNIISLNSQYIHSSLAPWYLKAGIEKYCESKINLKIIEDTINNNIDCVFHNITKNTPDVYGFCCYIWNIERTLTLISKIKQKYPLAIIVLGGPEVSYNAKELLKNDYIDFIVSGEGEIPFAKLLDAINKNLPTNMEGVCYKNREKTIISEPFVSNEQPPDCYCDEYFDNLNGRISYIETSRGCPFSCAFCLSGKCGKVQFFDMDISKQNILKLANSNTKTIKFVDRTFNSDKSRAKEIFKFIIQNYGKKFPTDKCFHFEIAGDILDDETISILNSAPSGLIQLEIGMQSFNEETLQFINRKTNIEKLINNIKRLTEKKNIHIHIDLIAGLPKEDFESFKNSFNIAFSLGADMLQLGFLKILHGSPMKEDFNKYKCDYSPTPPYEIISNEYITKEELQYLKYVESALDKLYNSGRFKRSLNYLWEICLSPFEFFYEFGKAAKENLPLDLYLSEFFKFATKQKNVDKKIFRDLLLLDRIATNSSGVIPDVLKVEDDDLKKAKNYLKNDLGKQPKKGVKRTVVKLYSTDNFAFVDYTEKKNITNEYRIEYFTMKNPIN